MPLIAQMFAVIAAILHIWFFVLESILWRRPPTWRRFRVASQEDADLIAPMARNQGSTTCSWRWVCCSGC